MRPQHRDWFPSYAAALACWHSDAYQSACALQRGGAETDLIVIEGYEGAQQDDAG